MFFCWTSQDHQLFKYNIRKNEGEESRKRSLRMDILQKIIQSRIGWSFEKSAWKPKELNLRPRVISSIKAENFFTAALLSFNKH